MLSLEMEIWLVCERRFGFPFGPAKTGFAFQMFSSSAESSLETQNNFNKYLRNGLFVY